MKQINFTNLKFLISFFMVCWSFPALSADSYNSNTGVLSIARVAVGDTVYSDVKITIGEVVELQRKVSHYLQPILSHRFLNNLA